MTYLKNIRKNIFDLTQSQFGRILGVDQSTVSNLEQSGDIPFRHMNKIRSHAKEQNIAFDDSWFFEIPEPENNITNKAS